MPFSPSDLAPEFLFWRTRLHEKVLRWPSGRTVLHDRFAEHLSAINRRRHLDDYRLAVDAFSRECPALIDWYGAVLRPFEDTLVFEDGAPRLRCGALGTWRRTTSRIDPDALLALCLARRMPAGSDPSSIVRQLPNWGYYISSGDHGLRQILKSGIADIHVHFEASDPLPLLWLRLACGQVDAGELRFFSDATLEGLGEDENERKRRRNDRKFLDQAASSRRDLAGLLKYAPADFGTGASPFSQALAAERGLLVSAWQRAIVVEDASLGRTLDLYLFIKSLFLRRHQQHADQGPGLDRFRDFLDRGETLGERKLKKVKPRVRRERFSRMISLATEPESLRILELRVAPQPTLRGWFDFFAAWNRVAEDRKEEWERRGLVVRFVVHFIRTSDGSRGRHDVEFGALRQKLDRQSAVLQLFRHVAPDLAGRIVGIDVANLERACPPEVFAPYLALLRGRGPAGVPESGGLLDCWSRLGGRQQHLPPLQLPPLGLTYHAGEDFYHPVDGLRAIDGLLENVLQPGDRLGHGLAVGWDLRKFERDRGPAPMPLGMLLDDLVWLRQELATSGAWHGTWQVDGDKLIDDLSRRIYEGYPTRGALERALAIRFRSPRRTQGGALLPKKGLLPEELIAELTAFDPRVAAARSRFADPEHLGVLALVSPVLGDLQVRLARKIRNAGVVVEANPSSNLATGAVDSIAAHPFFSYRQALGGQTVVTINTDDPGVFGTNLDIEFGLMFEAMLENGINRIDALRCLDGARSVALSYAFCRDGKGESRSRQPS